MILAVAFAVVSLLPLVGRAQVTATGAAPGLGPIADVLSASSWLLVSGQDPRYGDTAAHVWYAPPAVAPVEPTEGGPAATPSAARIVTESLGLVAIQSDPSLAVDPLDPERLVLAVNALDLPGVATYTSTDSGATWQGPGQAPSFAGDTGSAGSPAVAFGRDGALYLVSHSFHAPTSRTGVGDAQIDRSRITVSTSGDGGQTWGEPVSAALTSSDIGSVVDEFGTTRVDAARGFLDRPAIAIGPATERPEQEAIYVTYTDFQVRTSAADDVGTIVAPGPIVESTIRLVRSIDGGQSWSDPAAVSPTASRIAEVVPNSASPVLDGEAIGPAVPGPGAPSVVTGSAVDRVVQGAQVAVLSDGRVLVAYLDSTEDGPHQGLARVMVAVSEDGGRQFAEPVQAGLFLEVQRQPRTAFFPWWGTSFPRLAVGPENEVYIAATARPADRPADDADIALLRSLDGGITWESLPIAGKERAGSQFFPAISVSRDGHLVALWADTHDDPAGVSYAIYGAVSRDHGHTWRGFGADQVADAAMTRISDGSSNALLGFPGGRFLGDRLAVTVGGETVYGAWATTQLASDAPNLQVAVARLGLGSEAGRSGDDD